MSNLIAIVALVVSIVGILFAWQSSSASKDSARESKRSADAASAADRRARTPNLEIVCQSKAGRNVGEDSAIYEVINHGPEHLASVVVSKPELGNGISYPVAIPSQTNYADEADLGPIQMTRSARFTLCIGVWHEGEKRLAPFRLLIRATAADGVSWELPFTLDPPRKQPPGRVLSA